MAPNGMSDDQADRSHLMATPSTSSSTSGEGICVDDYQPNDKFGVHMVDIPEDRTTRTMALVGTKNPYLSDISVSKSPKSKKAKFCFMCTIILILALVGVTVTAAVEIVLKSQQDSTTREPISGSVLNTTSSIQSVQTSQSMDYEYDAFEKENSDIKFDKDSKKSNNQNSIM